jgi:hypothetical protein
MPVSLQAVIAAYEAGAEKHASGKPLLPGARAIWEAAHGAGPLEVGSCELRDSARRSWRVDVRRDRRGRYLQFRPVGIDIERFRASADGHLPQEWLPIAPLEWSAFALHAAAAKAAGGTVADEELAPQVRQLLDRMVREAQHRGLAFDEDED